MKSRQKLFYSSLHHNTLKIHRFQTNNWEKVLTNEKTNMKNKFNFYLSIASENFTKFFVQNYFLSIYYVRLQKMISRILSKILFFFSVTFYKRDSVACYAPDDVHIQITKILAKLSSVTILLHFHQFSVECRVIMS